MISAAGRRRPASADDQDADSASWRARRSSLVRSSPASSATRSITVPSGSVVGSSRTRRPFSTRARRGLMRRPVRLPPDAASRQAACRKSSISLSQTTIWFQLAGTRDATLVAPGTTPDKREAHGHGEADGRPWGFREPRSSRADQCRERARSRWGPAGYERRASGAIPAASGRGGVAARSGAVEKRPRGNAHASRSCRGFDAVARV